MSHGASCLGLVGFGSAWQAWSVWVCYGIVGSVMVRLGRRVQVWLVVVRRGPVEHGEAGMVRIGYAGQVRSGLGRRGPSRQCRARLGLVRSGRQGPLWSVPSRQGKVMQVRLVLESLGKVSFGSFGLARLGLRDSV